MTPLGEDLHGLTEDRAMVRAVEQELDWDPRAVDSGDTQVKVNHGVVTLSGSVTSLTEKVAIARAASRVVGVTEVVDPASPSFGMSSP